MELLTARMQDRDLFDEATSGILRVFSCPSYPSLEVAELISLHVQLRKQYEEMLIFKDIILEERIRFEIIWKGDVIEIETSILEFSLAILQLQVFLDALESNHDSVSSQVLRNVSRILKLSNHWN